MFKTKFLVVLLSIFCGFNAACLTSSQNSDGGTGATAGETKTDIPKEILTNKTKEEKPKSASKIEGGTFFKGQIGSSKIDLNLKREGDTLSGSYSYVKVGKPLNLSGKIGKDGNFTLTESDESGKITGEFKGKRDDNANKNGAELEGEWKKPSGATTQPFWAFEQMIFFTDDAKIISKTTGEENKKRRTTMEAEYPEVSGGNVPNASKFNELSKAFAVKQIEGFKKEMAEVTDEDLKLLPEGAGYDMSLGYNVEFANNDLISVLFQIYNYSGGAHGNTASVPLNFDVKTGKELKLADIFKPNSDYLATLSKYCITDLKKRGENVGDDEWINNGAGATEENYGSWNLTKKGLQITFDAYQVAAYAAGPQTVIIPYSELKDMVRKVN